MLLSLHRKESSSCATIGFLYLDGFFHCYTLEDCVREIAGVPVEQWKVAGETAIPVGTYDVAIDYSNRFGRPMPHILNVPGFEGIRIHSGNTAADTEGCILVGAVAQVKDFIGESRIAFQGLFSRLQNAFAAGEKITLEVKPFGSY